eukprot:scaffold49190_cov61-Phaeocystis_antarctica.AAC.2
MSAARPASVTETPRMPQGRLLPPQLLPSQHRSEHRCCLLACPLTTSPIPCPYPLAWRCRSAEASHAEAPLGQASTASHTTDTTQGRPLGRRMATAGWVGCPECPALLVAIAVACSAFIPARGHRRAQVPWRRFRG